MTAPITLFVYARPVHVRHTVEALQSNSEAEESDLVIFSDAARSADKEDAVQVVRDYCETITGFRSVTIYHRPHHYGLAKSIIEGVTQVLTERESVIVLEDDIVTSPYFLKYMNEALQRFKQDSRVASVSGYIYPVNEPLPEAFFLPGADCWGWATWRRGWLYFEPDGKYLLAELKRRKLFGKFNFNGTFPYTQMLRDQISGKNDSWAIRWHASIFLSNKLTLYPGRSLLTNIGIDGSGTHCSKFDVFNGEMSKRAIDLSNVEVKVSEEGLKAFEAFGKNRRFSCLKILVRKISNGFLGFIK